MEGPQGAVLDSGLAFIVDAQNFDIIHIDPWKQHTHLYKGTDATIDYINYIYNENPNVLYEVGTEEAIRKMNPWEIEYMLNKLKKKLSPEKFRNITYVVVQSGTALYKNQNIGEYDEKRFVEMIDIIKSYNIKTKCHNGDYLQNYEYHKHFRLGLDAVNIAPQVGLFESEILLSLFNKFELETLFNSCLISDRWKKWVSSDYNPYENKEELIRICGHYVLNNDEIKIIAARYPDIPILVKEKIYNKINAILAPTLDI
jgi:hypothetical protein